jgi:hypothetical protein
LFETASKKSPVRCDILRVQRMQPRDWWSNRDEGKGMALAERMA